MTLLAMAPCPSLPSKVPTPASTTKAAARNSRTASSKSSTNASSGPLVNCGVAQTLQLIETDLARLQPLKAHLQNVVQEALSKSLTQTVRDCKLELVGSSSWQGDVP